MKTRCIIMFVLLLLCVPGVYAQSQKWKFMVYGDTRGTDNANQINTTILSELVRVTTNENPAFVLVPGDLVYAGNTSAFQSWSNIMAPVYQAGIPVYPVRGNHDDDSDPTAYKNYFSRILPTNGPPAELGLTYAVFYSNVLVLALDNYVTAHQVNTNWIQAVLATNACLHIFAMAHEPAFKVNHTDCLDDVPATRNAFWNILSNVACRVYFCGHDHFYDHMDLDDGDGNLSNDIHQFIIGTGGAPLTTDGAYDGLNGIWKPTRVLHEQQYGYMTVEIDGYDATLKWFHRTGVNTYALASGGFFYTLACTITPNYTAGALTLTWSGGGRLQSAPDPAGPWTNVTNGISPFVKTDLASANEFYRVRLR